MTIRYHQGFVVGQTFSFGRIVAEREQLKRFAFAFDPQPFHPVEDVKP